MTDNRFLRNRPGARRVLSRAEYEALPEPHGAWWRAYYLRLDKAYREFEDEFGVGPADEDMLSVFPQPREALWGDHGFDGENDALDEDENN